MLWWRVEKEPQRIPLFVRWRRTKKTLRILAVIILVYIAVFQITLPLIWRIQGHYALKAYEKTPSPETEERLLSSLEWRAFSKTEGERILKMLTKVSQKKGFFPSRSYPGPVPSRPELCATVYVTIPESSNHASYSLNYLVKQWNGLDGASGGYNPGVGPSSSLDQILPIGRRVNPTSVIKPLRSIEVNLSPIPATAGIYHATAIITVQMAPRVLRPGFMYPLLRSTPFAIYRVTLNERPIYETRIIVDVPFEVTEEMLAGKVQPATEEVRVMSSP